MSDSARGAGGQMHSGLQSKSLGHSTLNEKFISDKTGS